MSAATKSQITEAITSGDLKAFKEFVVNHGLDLKAPIDDGGQTILHLAAFHGQLEIAEYCLKQGVLVDRLDKHNWTALICGASKGNVNICLSLLNHGAKANAMNDQNTSALHYLSRKLFTQDDVEDKPGKTSILASLSRYMKKDTQATTDVGNSKYFTLMETLLNLGADINLQNVFGETPLMQAAFHNNEEAVRFLLEHKAKWKLKNNKGETALQYAENQKNQNIIKLLQAQADKESKKKLVTHTDLKLDNYVDVVHAMSQPDTGVDVKDRKGFFITYENSFLGSELVDWMIKNLGFSIRSREEAAQYATTLLKGGFIQRLNGDRFKDSEKTYYRFHENPLKTNPKYGKDKDPKEKDPSTLWGESSPTSSPSSSVIKSPNGNMKMLKKKVSDADFEVLTVLGKGGFGKVMLVRKIDSGKQYALKKLNKAKIMEKPRDFKNLMSEKKILQNDCPFLVHLHYAFQTEKDFCLVMDFIGGGDLNFLLKRMKKIPEKMVQFIVAELVLALSYLHSRGIIYRDLKPQNIMFDLDAHVVLADFGLSKEAMVNAHEIQLHTACGTPNYSAPEVLEGNHYNKAVDYWSLGVVMYQILEGISPFQFTGDFAKLLRSILEEPLPPTKAASPAAQALLTELLDKDPLKRLDDPDRIKKHAFFKGIDWEKLEVKKLESPVKILPEFMDNFEKKYTTMPTNEPEKVSANPQNVADFSMVMEH